MRFIVDECTGPAVASHHRYTGNITRPSPLGMLVTQPLRRRFTDDDCPVGSRVAVF